MIKIFLKNWEELKRHKCIFAREIRFRQKRIDLIQIPLYKNKRLGTAHAIEFKLKNWRECFKQAKKNRLFMPKNTIAIWKNHISKVIKEELIDEGIGLIEVSYEKNRTILKPQQNPYIDKLIYFKLRKQIIKEEMGKKN
ncbi:MAG: hypothetical protein ACFFAN_12445 [Promethearchaeota archaeon]